MPEDPKPPLEFINFDYIKSNHFRVVHADGAYFALAQNGLTISFFSERQPIPRRITHRVNPDGSLGEEVIEQRVVRDAVVRDTEVAVTMTTETARRLKDKLEEILRRSEDFQKVEAK